MSPQVIRLSKIEAAERQIREAIRLFAEDRDPVTVRTVAGAAHQVSRGQVLTYHFLRYGMGRSVCQRWQWSREKPQFETWPYTPLCSAR